MDESSAACRMGESYKSVPIDEFKRLACGKGSRIGRETAGGDQDATVCALGRDHPKQLSDPLNWDFSVQPVLALDNHVFAAVDKFEVDAAVGLASTSLPDRIALLAVGLTDQELKVRPAYLPECLDPGGS